MRWRDNIVDITVWHDDIGTDNTRLRLDRIGPLFRVSTDKTLYGLTGYALNPLWYFSYKTARKELDRRKLLLVEEIYGD